MIKKKDVYLPGTLGLTLSVVVVVLVIVMVVVAMVVEVAAIAQWYRKRDHTRERVKV